MQTTNDSKKRGSRTTQEQFALMVNFIEENQILVQGKTPVTEATNIQKLWEELTHKLNSCKGPEKTDAQWKRTFVEYKSKVKAKARGILVEINQTGGGQKKEAPLSDLEERLMGLVGWVTCAGDPNLNEISGLSSKVPAQTSPTTEVDDCINDNEEGMLLDNTASQDENIVELKENYPVQKSLKRKKKTLTRPYKKGNARLADTVHHYDEANAKLCRSIDDLTNSNLALVEVAKVLSESMLSFAAILDENLQNRNS